MDSTAPPIVPMTLSNADSESFDQWREEWMLPVLRADVEAPVHAEYRSWMRVLRLPKVTITQTDCTPSILRRTRRLAQDGDGGLSVNLPWEGGLNYRARDGEGRLQADQAMVLPLDEPSSLAAPDGVRGMVLQIDRPGGHEGFTALERHLRRPLPIDPMASRLLRGYLTSLLTLEAALPSALAQVAERQVQELLANAFDPFSDLARAAPYGGVRAARLQAVAQEILRRLDDPSLSAASVGRRLGISERYVQQLLEETGQSFSGFVRQRRLEKARELLRDPAAAHLNIADIAGAAGFGDLSHFNREFRRRFGETPRDMRRRRAP